MANPDQTTAPAPVPAPQAGPMAIVHRHRLRRTMISSARRRRRQTAPAPRAGPMDIAALRLRLHRAMMVARLRRPQAVMTAHRRHRDNKHAREPMTIVSQPRAMEDEPVAPADIPSLSASGDESDELDLRQCRQILAGDNQACAELFKRHEPRVARLMWRFTRDRGTQAELVHEVFVQVYLSLPRFRPHRAPFEHWVFRLATRVGYQFWKTQARRRRMQPLGEIDPAVATVTDQTNPAAAAETLHRLLAQLPSADRLVLTLMYFEDCSMKEIARHAGWNETLVKMRAYRARKRLKRIIEQNQMTELLTGISHGTT